MLLELKHLVGREGVYRGNVLFDFVEAMSRCGDEGAVLFGFPPAERNGVIRVAASAGKTWSGTSSGDGGRLR